MKETDTVGQPIRKAREEQGLSQDGLGKRLDYSGTAVSHWENDRAEPSLSTLKRIAKALGKPTSYFLQDTDLTSVEREIEYRLRQETRLGFKWVAVLGVIQAGLPLLSEEHIEEWLPVPAEMGGRADFALRVRGDSMIGLGIQQGDLVLIRKADAGDIRPGQIVAALVNGNESTLKLLAFHDGRYWLEPANSHYQPIPVDKDVRVQGVYVGLYTERVPEPPSRPAIPHGDPLAVPKGLLDELARQEGIDAATLRRLIDAVKPRKEGDGGQGQGEGAPESGRG